MASRGGQVAGSFIGGLLVGALIIVVVWGFVTNWEFSCKNPPTFVRSTPSGTYFAQRHGPQMHIAGPNVPPQEQYLVPDARTRGVLNFDVKTQDNQLLPMAGSLVDNKVSLTFADNSKVELDRMDIYGLFDFARRLCILAVE
jgi:hypothetical protein